MSLCYGRFVEFPSLLPSLCFTLDFFFFVHSANVSGRRLVTTLPKYVRLWPSDTKQKCAGRVGVKHREGKDPREQHTPAVR